MDFVFKTVRTKPPEELTVIEEDWTPPTAVNKNLKEVIWFGMDNGDVYTSHVEILNDDGEGGWGILSFEEFYGELGYSIETALGDDFPKFGYFRMEGADLCYSKDYWGEVDADFYPGEIRPETLSEIREQFGEPLTLRTIWDQLKAAFVASRRMEAF